MSNVTEVSKSGEIENGTMKEISVNGHEILLARVDDQYYATGKDGRVVRWLKGSGFVSAIGKALKSPRPLVTYNVKIQDDKILIEI